MPKPKTQVRRVQVQFHLAQRNYRRIIKRMRATLLDEPLEPAENMYKVESTPTLKRIVQKVRVGVLHTITTLLEIPYKHEARVACMEFVMSMLFAFC